jgi:hypothetical protein
MMAKYLVENYAQYNFTVIHSEKDREKELSSFFKDEFATQNMSLRMIMPDKKFSNVSFSGTRNMVVICSSDEAFVISVLNKLRSSAEKHGIRVVGLPTWEKFESVDFGLFEKFKVMVFNSDQVDFESEAVRRFRSLYLNRFGTEPGPMSFRGFDQLMCYQNLFFEKSLSDISENNLRHTGLINLYDFEKADGGWLNQKIFILGFDNYAFKILKR